jgi:predicted amidohydrolase
VEQVADRFALVMTGNELEATHGWWVRDFDVQSGKWYKFQARYEAINVALPRRSVIVRIERFNANGKMILRPEYPPTTSTADDGVNTIESVYEMPEGTRRVRIRLVLRWAPNATVKWRDVKLSEAEAPQPRPVRVATVRYRPGRRTTGPEENRELFGEMIDKAAENKPDIIVLGEGITVVDTGKGYVDVAEAVPGPTTEFLGRLSRKHDCYIVTTVYERDGKIAYNTGVMLGPDGKLVGKYRKTALPREEIKQGLMPGHEYPVFDTRFGKVGMMICWDVHFPIVARRLAINGAELICLPIWGGNETLAQARAIENQVHVITSSYNINIRSAIFDPFGEALAVATDEDPIAVADIDLSKRYLYPYIGNFKARIERERPPLDGERR